MKPDRTILIFLISACSLVFAFCSARQQRTEDKFLLRKVNAKTLIPEGIAVHPATGQVFLSSLHENKIVAVDKNGDVRDIIPGDSQGFMWGLGMKFSKDGKVLWACSADGKGNARLYAIDHRSGRVITSLTHDSARFFNDLVVLNDGRIFITDTEAGALFLLQNDSLQLFLKDQQLTWANGIAATPDGDLLFVSSGRYGMMKVNSATRAIASATDNKRTDYAIDGLVLDDHILYATIGWPQDSLQQHRIIRYFLNENFNYLNADTLVINKSWLQCPTTLAVQNGQLFALATTNLGIYNRHQQQTTNILDSLVPPIIAVIPLQQK